MKINYNAFPTFTRSFLRRMLHDEYIITPVKPRNFDEIMNKVPRNTPVEPKNFQNNLREVPIPDKKPKIPLPKKRKLYPTAPQNFLKPNRVG